MSSQAVAAAQGHDGMKTGKLQEIVNQLTEQIHQVRNSFLGTFEVIHKQDTVMHTLHTMCYLSKQVNSSAC
jgi:hypothetical protein